MENQDFSFKKYTGKETKVHVESETLITQGTFGDIFDTVVEIGGHRKKFIVKKYTSIGRSEKSSILPEEYIEEMLRNDTTMAFERYSLAKKAGLKVFPTFRIGEDEKSILMTTGFSDNEICVGTNSMVSVKNFEKPLIQKIENVDQFLADFFAEGLKATQQGILLYFDVFFFILSKKEPTKVDFLIGDFDNFSQPGYEIKNLKYRNMEQIRNALEDFCKRNIHKNYTGIFLEKVEYYFQQARGKWE